MNKNIQKIQYKKNIKKIFSNKFKTKMNYKIN